jgi:hypothetical protein
MKRTLLFLAVFMISAGYLAAQSLNPVKATKIPDANNFNLQGDASKAIEELCYWNSPAWYYELPDGNNAQKVGTRFTATTDNSFLYGAKFWIFFAGTIGVPELMFEVWTVSAGDGFPEVLLGQVMIPADEVQYYPEPSYADLTELGLTFNTGDEFYITMSVIGGENGVLQVGPVSDDGPGDSRSVWYLDDPYFFWYPMDDYYGAREWMMCADLSSDPVWVGYNTTGDPSDWHDGSNWSTGVVPAPTQDVTIPVKDLTSVDESYPELFAPATVNDILFESNGVGTAAILDNGLLTVNGATTIESHFFGGEADWHLVSSPLTMATSNVFMDMYLQSFNESTNAYTEITSTSHPLTPMEGFAAYSTLSTTNTVFYNGPFNTGTLNRGFTANNMGWNLFGNPFQSSLDWEAVVIPTGMSNEVHFIDAATGNDLSYVKGVGGTATQFIPPHQGFFIKASANGTLSLGDAQRSLNGTKEYYKNNNANLLVLKASGEMYADETWIHFNEDAEAEHDGKYDAYKRISYSNADLPQFFSITPSGEYLAINGMPETTSVPLGFTAVNSGEYTIEIAEAGEFSDIILEDMLVGVQTDLKTGSYTFTHTDGDNINRFMLSFAPLSVDEMENGKFDVYSYRNEIMVSAADDVEGDIQVFNMTGQLIESSRIAGSLTTIVLNDNGNYIVRVMSDQEVSVKKVTIKN